MSVGQGGVAATKALSRAGKWDKMTVFRRFGARPEIASRLPLFVHCKRATQVDNGLSLAFGA
jgi:hypothetical protein